MDFSSAWQWWAEWQLQVLVLASLANQCFLLVAGGMRRHRTRPYFKLFTWLSFLASDAVALWALATPMLQWKLQQYISPHRNHDLEVLWAPVLLMHLGGQRCISAYNLEDNELWRRQGMTSLAKVTLTIYVFCKTWSPSADKRLLVAAVLLFISGVAKCVDRPLSLKSSSFQSLSNFVNDAQGSTRAQGLGLDEFVRGARAFFLSGEANNIPTAFPPIMPAHLPQKLFVDFSHSYSDRLLSLKSFWALDEEQMYKVLRSGLTDTFELLYTQTHAPLIGNSRAPIQYFYAILGSATFLPIVAILLFHVSSKQAYRGVDVAVTFVVLYGTAAVEIISVWLTLRSRTMWPDMVAQQNIFRYFAHNKRHSKLMRFAGWLQCKDLIDKYYWCMDPCYDSRDITRLIRTHINLMWTSFIKKPETYIGYTNVRGQWILEGTDYAQILGWSIEMPFDESVIIWHIVMEILFYPHKDDMPYGLFRCRQMSNYMMHLLFAESEMLLPGSRKSMFIAACNQLGDILRGEDVTWDDADGLVLKVIDKLMVGGVPEEASFFRDAWSVVEQFLDLPNDNVCIAIQGMWVEMLCFSAGRCRGYLHAKSLGSSGGEYLSFVSLLLAYTGMPTLADRLQTARPFHPDTPQVLSDAAIVLAAAADLLPDVTADVLLAAAEVFEEAAKVLPEAAVLLARGSKVLAGASEELAGASEELAEAEDVLAAEAEVLAAEAEELAGLDGVLPEAVELEQIVVGE